MSMAGNVTAAIEKQAGGDGAPPSPPTNGNGHMTSRLARDLALGVCLVGVGACTVASYFTYPLHEAGATTGLFILSNTAAFLLGMKGALSTKA